MAVEIERKFMVQGEFRKSATKMIEITQAYLSSDPERTIRIRIQDDEAFLTVKGISNKSGLSRLEYEYSIPKADAENMLSFCEAGVVVKTRFLVPVGNHTWELDVFHGDNQGLIIAEIELSSEDEDFIKPEWVGREVTGDLRYYNSALLKRPYKQWA